MSTTSSLYAGIELGGTKCICILGSGPHDIREQVSIPTGDNPQVALSQMEASLRAWYVKHGAVAALGIASFGPVDLNIESDTYGYITSTPKPGWSNTNVAQRLLNVYSTLGASSVALGFNTDVNGAALAEGRWGVSQGLHSHAYVTVGTGVGVGLVVGGRTVHGFSHPELGHLRVARMAGDHWPGACKFHGDCVEGLVSGPAIAARTLASVDAISPNANVWDTVAHALAQLMHAMVVTTTPQRIVIGGGVVNGHPELFPRIRKLLVSSLNNYLLADELTTGIDAYVVPPGLGELAGPLGALAVAADACNISHNRAAKTR